MFLGGAGGGGQRVFGVGAGANGGALVLIFSPNITVTGTINDNGDTAAQTAQDVGGSGAGGCVLLKGNKIVLGSGLVTAIGGTATTPSGTNHTGGAGGVGYIHADYGSSISGTTNPTIDTTKDKTLAIAMGGAFLYNII